jgi:hypothetical protein
MFYTENHIVKKPRRFANHARLAVISKTRGLFGRSEIDGNTIQERSGCMGYGLNILHSGGRPRNPQASLQSNVYFGQPGVTVGATRGGGSSNNTAP